MQVQGGKRNYRNGHMRNGRSHSSGLDAELKQLWKEKYEFNKRELRLSDHKAKEWASRTIRAIEHSDAAGPDVQASAKS